MQSTNQPKSILKKSKGLSKGKSRSKDKVDTDGGGKLTPKKKLIQQSPGSDKKVQFQKALAGGKATKGNQQFSGKTVTGNEHFDQRKNRRPNVKLNKKKQQIHKISGFQIVKQDDGVKTFSGRGDGKKPFSPGKKKPGFVKKHKKVQKDGQIKPKIQRSENTEEMEGNDSPSQKRKHEGEDDQKGAKKKKLDAEDDEEHKNLKHMNKKERVVMWKKMRNSNYDLAMKAKHIWEVARRSDCPKPKRIELITDLHNLVSGKVGEMIFQADMSRVVECLMALGTQEVRQKLFDELKDKIVDLAKEKYSKFFVIKALKYGTKEQRRIIMKAFHGKVETLVRHSEAAAVVECAYNEFANAAERAALIEEFYGPNYAVFKDGEVKTLEQVLAKHPDKKASILSHMKDTLLAIVEKKVVRHSIVHHIIHEFFLNADQKDRSDMIEAIREVVVQILHTPEGCRVGMECVWRGSGKDRKVIIKSLKSHVVKICKEQYGHQVLLAIFDCVDDTVLVRNVILKELLLSALEVATDPNGRKVILHLLSPRDTAFFLPQVVQKLKEGDTNDTSRKDPSRRHEELLAAVSQPLLQLLAAEPSEMVRNASNSVVARTILLNCKGDPTAAYSSISELVAEPFIAGNVERYHVIEDAASHMLLKKIIKADAEKYKDGEKVLFSQILLNTVPEESLGQWLDSNRGAFILINLLETQIPDVVTTVKTLLAPLRKKLKHKTYKAADILRKKLKE